jgi:type I restriction enzyme S subunit
VSDWSLPSSWVEVPIADIADINSKAFSPLTDTPDLSATFVSMSHVAAEFGGIDVSSARPLGDVARGYASFIEGDVLFAKITPCMENGKVAVVPKLPESVGFGSTEFHVLRATEATHPRWLAYYLSQRDFRRQARQEMTGSAGQLRVAAPWLSSKAIPLAPRHEQTRIVEKLDELLTDLDAGVAELEAAQKKLARYRQSLLKAAVEGTLTADWRAERARRGETFETGPQLLERILRERRARWEEKQLAKFEAQGKAPPKGWRENYPEPIAPSAASLPLLPEGWTWASIDQLADFITSGSRGWADYYADAGATFIRSQNINKDWLDLSDIAFVALPERMEGLRTRVARDDILLTITGANVGKAAYVLDELDEAYVSQHVALIRMVDTALARYIHLFLTADSGGRRQLNKMAYGAGKPGLNLQQVANVFVPIAGTAEIAALVQAVDGHLNGVADQNASISAALRITAAQRQNILRAAFSGRLVPQDPADEPASALLERIRAERASQASSTPKRRASARTHKATPC